MQTSRHRLQRLLVALVATLAVLVVPDAARAATGPVDAAGPDVSAALQIAAQHWGATPCGGQFTVTWTASADTLLNGTSEWTNPVDLWNAPDRNGSCVIELNADAPWDWAKLCTVVTHEAGHLLGHQHAADPDDLMAPVYKVALPACLSTPEPEGTLTAAAAAQTRAQAATVAPPAAAAVPVDVIAAAATVTPRSGRMTATVKRTVRKATTRRAARHPRRRR